MSRFCVECLDDNGRPADRIARVQKELLAQIQLLQQFVIFRQVVLLQVIEQFAAAAGHLEKSAPGVKVLPVGAQMLSQMVDARRQESDLHLALTGVLFVDFVFCDNLWLGDCRHFYVVELHDCREPLQAPCRPHRRG
jgi:hypothetical protein